MIEFWTDLQLQRFLQLRQELFLDPLGSNRVRFEEAAVMLQRALFSWYFSKPDEFGGLISLVQRHSEETRRLRKEEAATIQDRRFALNYPAAEIPAVESGVSENQWQQIYGSLGAGHGSGNLFERFLIDLDSYTNPSLRINHRYLGELLPHDNMVGYFSSIAATFLNENAIIGKVSPCVTHMEQAATALMAQLVGWEGKIEIDDSAERLPLQRLPTPYPPAQDHERWAREQPTGAFVGDGTIANISAMLIARNATFNYLLGWGEAVQELGPDVAWEIIREVYPYERLAAITSKGAHYSVQKAAHLAGVSPLDIVEVAGSANPWVLDAPALEHTLKRLFVDGRHRNGKHLLLGVVLIAGKTETGYIDRLAEVACVLNHEDYLHPELKTIHEEKRQKKILELIQARCERWRATNSLDHGEDRCKDIVAAYESLPKEPRFDEIMEKRSLSELPNASYRRTFIHVDAAHGGAFLTVPDLRTDAEGFDGIELVDTATIDGHKMFYCYYPCGGLLIRAARWARTLHGGHSKYISEDTSHEAYGEDRAYLRGLRLPPNPDERLIEPSLPLGRTKMARVDAIRAGIGRPTSGSRSELRHQPFLSYLEGSRGCQGIMQMYFNLRAIGFEGYRSLLEWTHLLTRRCEEAVSLGRIDVRPVTETVLLKNEMRASAKHHMLQIRGPGNDDAAVKWGKTRRIVPVLGGRLLRLSAGKCNQLLVSYVPLDVAMHISTYKEEWRNDWRKKGTDHARPGSNRFWQTMHYLWRVNEHLWFRYLYANPSFTYYVGHTIFEPILPYPAKAKKDDSGKLLLDESRKPILDEVSLGARRKNLACLLAEWNVWARWRVPVSHSGASGADGPCDGSMNDTGAGQQGSNQVRQSGEGEKDMENIWECPFFDELANCVQDPSTPRDASQHREGPVRFFCHKIVVMHPYTDESILSDLLGKIMFWGERSAEAVRLADAACAEWLDGHYKYKENK